MEGLDWKDGEEGPRNGDSGRDEEGEGEKEEEGGEVTGEVEQVEESNGVEEEGTRKTTRSRGAIEINLWDLENPEDTLKSSSVKK